MAEPEAFIVMQFGDELRHVCETAIVPAIREAGLKDRRVDRDHQGHMLKAEIMEFLENSEIIVADLTHERPNCYLEVGYAMGLKKNANLILTVRQDHHPSGEGWTKDGPQVHFDLSGYPLIFWTPDNLPKFKDDLAAEIKRRLETTGGAAPIVSTTPAVAARPPMESWRRPLKSLAFRQFPKAQLTLGDGGKLPAYFEVSAEIVPPLDLDVTKLAEAQYGAGLDHTGWPFGIVMIGHEDAPRIKRDGIESVLAYNDSRGSVDCSKLFTDGRLWVFRDLLEDREPLEGHEPEAYFYADLQTERVAEAILFVARLYRRLGAGDDARVTIELRFSGLEERRIGMIRRARSSPSYSKSYEDDADHTISASLSQLEAEAGQYTKEFIAQVLVLFNGLRIDDQILDNWIAPVLESAKRP